MLKANFITQLILEIKLVYYILSLWSYPGMSDHTHLKQLNNVCCVMDSSHIQKFNLITQLIYEIF